MGVTFAPPKVDLAKLKTHKEKVIGKLTGGLAAMAKMRKVTVVQGTGEFARPVPPERGAGQGRQQTRQTIRFKQAIIAAGSEAVKLPFLPKDDPRIVTSTGALELRQNGRRSMLDRRRRHHRAGDGHGVLDAGRDVSTWSRCSTA